MSKQKPREPFHAPVLLSKKKKKPPLNETVTSSYELSLLFAHEDLPLKPECICQNLA